MESTEAVTGNEMIQTVRVDRWSASDCRPDEDSLVIEEPLEIRLNDISFAVTMRTPGQDEALAVGFLATEGVLLSADDLYDITRCADPQHPDLHNILGVYIDPERMPDELQSGRQRYANSSCGLCGKATIEAVRQFTPAIVNAPDISRSLIQLLPDRLRTGQQVFSRTGGLHAAGLFNRDGDLLFVEEDIGRHNAVDKAIGRALLSGLWPLENTILMVSGRAGFEIVQKALAARIPTVCSVSAPSSLAVQLAQEAGMTLIGFLRGNTMNVYSGFERVTL
jgi:FdhD protein